MTWKDKQQEKEKRDRDKAIGLIIVILSAVAFWGLFFYAVLH